jgi:tetratricopeptide (TPR) repeat protein
MSMPGIGKALGVRNIIEGSVLSDGNRVRIMVQLVDAARDVQIWAGSFERQLTGVLGLQNDIASSVADAVEIQLSDAEASMLARQPEVNPQSYDIYLRGMYRIHNDSDLVRLQGVRILSKAVEKEPDNALLQAGLAYGYALLGHSPFPEDMYPSSTLAAARALALDDSIAIAHVAVGMQKMYYEWDFAAAENALLHALELNPSLAQAHYHYAWLMELYRDSARSIPPGEKSVETDPLDPFLLGWLSAQYRSAGRYEDALRVANETVELEPGHPVALRTKALIYADMGDFERALEASSQIADHPKWRFVHGVVLARAGDEAGAREILDSFERTPRNVVPLLRLHSTLGDTEDVFAWLDVARDVKLPWYPWFITWFPQMDNYQDDPRMRKHAQALGIEHILDNILAGRE